MELLIIIISTIALIPMVLFLYALLSGIFQVIFNKNYDADAHDLKWQLKSKVTYALTIIGFFCLIGIVIDNVYYSALTNLASLITIYCYGFILAKHNLKSLFSNLS